MTEFYLVRHGQTFGNVQGISQGTTNSEIAYLNNHGKHQIQQLHDHFDIKFADQIITSPLVRTRQTTEILNQAAQLPVSSDERLLEISYGDWDGHLKTELRDRYPDLFNNDTNDVIPGYATVAHGETFTDVEQRVADFLSEVTRRFPSQKIIVVSHGFTIRSAVVAILSVADPFAVPEPENGSVTKITSNPINSRYTLNYFNRI